MKLKAPAVAVFFAPVALDLWMFSVAVNVLPSKLITLTKDHTEEYIESPNYPDDYYPQDTQIQYKVEVKMGNHVLQEMARIQVTFEVFLMERSAFCHKDGLDIVDRTGEVRAYCGPQSGRNFLMEDSVIIMRMYTDAEGRDRGFRIRVRLHQSPCGGILRPLRSGYITTPDYPYSYGAHRLCVWRIQATFGMRIKLSFDGYFDIRSDDHDTCFMDYLEISRSGKFETDSQRYCGQTRPKTIMSTTNKVELKFVSDCCEEGRGFKLRYDVIPSWSVVPTPATDRYRPVPCHMADCGKPQELLPRIVGGQEYTEHKHPWLVAIFDKYNDFICVGSLVSPRHVLTAAHCCDGQKSLSVKTGVHRLTDGPHQAVQRCHMHPHYRKRNLANDIALLELAISVNYNEFQRPICLPLDAKDLVGKDGVIAGWGRESYGGRDRQTPKEASVPFVSQSECTTKYGAIILESNVCAGGNAEDACQGDSGGPLMSSAHAPNRVVQMGIVSTGIGCGRKGHPGIYTRITSYHDFIYNLTRQQWCTVQTRRVAE
ncbi:vitamin K-dependent protein C isoform X1 [Dermacentor silvarum]|uniref:vitamin K-dependent protein C isoform X1 n=2 Tax=Dermacentor silvarum TaxID=543639 RepID=UPI00189BC125|nr:vitamin K-dependent protein C isoform X1 [Dermacentor silvarum]